MVVNLSAELKQNNISRCFHVNIMDWNNVIQLAIFFNLMIRWMLRLICCYINLDI